jgi:SAM-dependent methyltransferase
MGSPTFESIYRFVACDACNMCGHSSTGNRVLGKRLNAPQGLRPKGQAGVCVSVQECVQCGLIYPNPMPVPGSIEQHYGTPPESYWKPEYFEISDDYFSSQIAKLRQLVGPSGGEKRLVTLDIGAGIGKGMIAMERAGFDVYGIEPSGPFREMAISRLGIDPSRIQLASIETAAFEDEMFDFINFAAVLEHLYDPSAMLQKSLRWLKRGGLMYVEVPSSSWLISRAMRLFYRATGSDYVINLCPMHAPFHLFEFTLQSFMQHGRAHGYEIAFHEYFPCNPFLPRPFHQLAVAVMARSQSGMQLAVWPRKV